MKNITNPPVPKKGLGGVTKMVDSRGKKAEVNDDMESMLSKRCADYLFALQAVAKPKTKSKAASKG